MFRRSSCSLSARASSCSVMCYLLFSKDVVIPGAVDVERAILLANLETHLGRVLFAILYRGDIGQDIPGEIGRVGFPYLVERGIYRGATAKDNSFRFAALGYQVLDSLRIDLLLMLTHLTPPSPC